MTHDELDDAPETSLFTVGTSVLINWRPVLMCTLAGALIALLTALIQPDVYVASASFVRQGERSKSLELGDFRRAVWSVITIRHPITLPGFLR